MLNIQEYAKSGVLFDERYLLLRPLSVDGATADVWLALDTKTVSEGKKWKDAAHLSDQDIEQIGLIVAIKIYRPQNVLDKEGENRFKEEYIIVFNCHHANLIHPTHFAIFKETPYLVLPYCKLGSSELLIGEKLSNDYIWKYIHDVASGIAYLHALTPPIIHQDIKPANILLDDNNNFSITDFGISAQRGGVHGYYYDDENSGTLAYMAPERFHEGAEPIPQSDIWALGATLCEIITGEVPFGEDGGMAQEESNLPTPHIKGVSADIQKLIHDCLEKDPAKRPSAKQLVEAAESKQYPVKSKKFLIPIFSLFMLAVVGFATYYFIKPKEKAEVYQPNLEELYNKALEKLDANDSVTVRKGLELMDSLSNQKYIPAMYQVAFTYGWYTHETSRNRKKILKIEVYDDLPKNMDLTRKTMSNLLEIVHNSGDSIFYDYRANAAYRIASYYLDNTNKNPYNPYGLFLDEGEKFLNMAKKWEKTAIDKKEILLDSALTNNIISSLNEIKNNKNKKRNDI